MKSTFRFLVMVVAIMLVAVSFSHSVSAEDVHGCTCAECHCGEDDPEGEFTCGCEECECGGGDPDDPSDPDDPGDPPEDPPEDPPVNPPCGQPEQPQELLPAPQPAVPGQKPQLPRGNYGMSGGGSERPQRAYIKPDYEKQYVKAGTLVYGNGPTGRTVIDTIKDKQLVELVEWNGSETLCRILYNDGNNAGWIEKGSFLLQ